MFALVRTAPYLAIRCNHRLECCPVAGRIAMPGPVSIHLKAPGVRYHLLVACVLSQVVDGPVDPLGILDQLVWSSLRVGDDRAKLDVISAEFLAKSYHVVNLTIVASVK